MDDDLLRETYFKELDERHRLDGRITLQVGVLTIGGGVLAALFRSFAPEQSLLYGIFMVFAGSATLLFLFALIWVLRANIGHDYSRLPYLGDLRDHLRELETYYEARGNVADAATEYETYLRERLIEATDHNIATNLSRSGRFYLGNTFIAWMVLFLALAGVPAVLKLATTPSPQGVADERQVLTEVSGKLGETNEAPSRASENCGEAEGETREASEANDSSDEADQEASGSAQHDLQRQPESSETTVDDVDREKGDGLEQRQEEVGEDPT